MTSAKVVWITNAIVEYCCVEEVMKRKETSESGAVEKILQLLKKDVESAQVRYEIACTIYKQSRAEHPHVAPEDLK